MLSLNSIAHLIGNPNHILTPSEKEAIRQENKDGNYSYQCLMNEMFGYKEMSIDSILNGWGGVKVFERPLNKLEKKTPNQDIQPVIFCLPAMASNHRTWDALKRQPIVTMFYENSFGILSQWNGRIIKKGEIFIVKLKGKRKAFQYKIQGNFWIVLRYELKHNLISESQACDHAKKAELANDLQKIATCINIPNLDTRELINDDLKERIGSW